MEGAPTAAKHPERDSGQTGAQIASIVPDARIIAGMSDPVERATPHPESPNRGFAIDRSSW